MKTEDTSGPITTWWRRVTAGLSQHRGAGTRRLAENFLSLSVLQAVGYLLPLITLPYLVRTLGVDRFGLIAFAQAITQYFIILTDYGFNLWATREIASHRRNMARVSEVFCSVLAVKLVLLILGLGILCLLVFSVGRFADEPWVYLFAYGMVLGNVLFPVWFFQGMEKMWYSTVLTLVARSIFVVLIFVFIRSPEDYLLVPVLNSLGLIVAGTASLWMAWRKFSVILTFPTWHDLADQIRDSFQFFLSRVSVTVYTALNTVVLGFLTNNETVGYYAAAEKLFIAIRSAFYPLVQSLYPYMSSSRNIALFKKIFYVALVVAGLAATLAFLMSGTITKVVFGSDYQASAKILQLFSLMVPIVAASILLGYPFLAALGREKYANFSIAAASIGHLILIGLIIPVISSQLVVVVTMVTETFILAIRIYGVRKHKLWITG